MLLIAISPNIAPFRSLARVGSTIIRSVTAIILTLSVSVAGAAAAAEIVNDAELWSLRPVVEPTVPETDVEYCNPIDAFLGQSQQQSGLRPLGRADRRTLLRRVSAASSHVRSPGLRNRERSIATAGMLP